MRAPPEKQPGAGGNSHLDGHLGEPDRLPEHVGQPPTSEAEVRDGSGPPRRVENRLRVRIRKERQCDGPIPADLEALDTRQAVPRPRTHAVAGDADLEPRWPGARQLLDATLDDQPPPIDDRDRLAQVLNQIELVA